MAQSTDNKQAIDRPEVAAASRRHGVNLGRFFTRPGVDPMDEVEWEYRSAVIAGEDGRVVFEQRDIEIPRDWSQTAANGVASKYFLGPLCTARRETSVLQLILPVVDTVTGWGEHPHYVLAAA